ncbi:MAG: hypothetical protein JSS43_15500 [Proteobacteria bacterium]|nr:hypothetical protein [Pseudomonadota bacterium]
MSTTPVIPAAIIETVLALIMPLILPGVDNDREVARATAWHMIGDYKPRTAEEFRLAGQIVSFSLQSIVALADATKPDLSVNQICRYRASAVSLKRAEVAAQRQLDALRKAAPQDSKAEPDLAAVGDTPAAPAVEPDAPPPGDPDVAAAAELAAPSAPPAAPAIPSMLAERTQPVVQAAAIAIKANNPTHARQLAEAARKAAMTKRMVEAQRRRAAAYQQAQAGA